MGLGCLIDARHRYHPKLAVLEHDTTISDLLRVMAESWLEEKGLGMPRPSSTIRV